MRLVVPYLTNRGLIYLSGPDYYPVQYVWDWPPRRPLTRPFNWRFDA